MKTKLIALSLLALLFLVVPALIAQEPQMSDDEKKVFLTKAKITDSKPIGKGITHPWRLTLSDGKVTHDAAFQAVDERKNNADLGPQGMELMFRDSYHFDIAAYEMAALLGLGNMMPVTVLRNWRGDDGALSWWIPDTIDELTRRQKNLVPPDVEDYNRQIHRMRVFSELVYDTDRNIGGNVLVDPKTFKVYMIDFTRAFRLLTDLKDKRNLERCDRQLFEKLKSLTQEQVKQAVGKHLTGPEVNGLMKRRDKIIEVFTQLAAQKGDAAIFF